ncbi:MAG: hypothetical protein PVF14_13350 [Desulfobacterales bacterium]
MSLLASPMTTKQRQQIQSRSVRRYSEFVCTSIMVINQLTVRIQTTTHDPIRIRADPRIIEIIGQDPTNRTMATEM